MKIREKCSCGATIELFGDDAEKLHRAWVRRHVCPESSSEHRDIETTATIGFSADYSGTGLDLPAKNYDPWEDE